MDRKDFLKSLAFASAAAGLNMSSFVAKASSSGEVTSETLQSPNGTKLVAVMGGEPVIMLEKMLQELGGIKKFVKKGDKVVIKPNIGWDKAPELAANTNPLLVGALTKLCIDAGASEVAVFDHTCDNWNNCYKNSGIKKSVEEAGGKMVPGNDEAYYVEQDIPGGVKLKKAKIHKVLLDCDVWFNVPVLKNHGGAKMTLCMKNYMGIVWDRGEFHSVDLQQCIADINTFSKKPALHILDGYRLMKQNGPQGKTLDDVVNSKVLFASTDPVAVDTAAVKFFGQITEMDINTVSHIGKGEELKLGTTNLNTVDVKRIKL